MTTVRDPQDIETRRREFLAAIRPYTDAQVRVYCLATPKWLLHADGRIEQSDDGLWPGGRDALQRLDDCIADVAKRFRLHVPNIQSQLSANPLPAVTTEPSDIRRRFT